MSEAPPLPILFDLDGTLVDSLPDIAASVNHVRVHFGLPELSLELARTMVGDGLMKLLERALEHLAHEVLDAALEVYREHHLDQCTRLVEPFAGVPEHLAAWYDAGHPLAVVTNKPELFVHRILEHLDLARWLPVVVGGDTTPVRKPDPAPVFAALDRLSVPRGRGLMVGDSPGDVAAGRAAGIRTAAVLYGYRSEAELRAVDADEYWPTFGMPGSAAFSNPTGT